MLWLIVLVIVGGMLFVLFNKPPINMAGIKHTASPPTPVRPTESKAVEPTVPVAAPTPETFNFNDLFSGPRNDGPTDRPSA